MAWSLMIVDDHPELRRATCDLLSSDAFVVIGEAAALSPVNRLTRTHLH